MLFILRDFVMCLVWFGISERMAGGRHVEELGVRILVAFMGQ